MQIKTPRLLLRPYEEDDLMDLHEIFSDPVVMLHCEAPYDLEKTKHILSLFRQKNIALGAVHQQESRLIGHLLFKQLPGEEEGIYEIGWIFHRAFWRQGLAFEAASALMHAGFHQMNLHKICAETIDPDKSVPLMRKLGMKQEGLLQEHAKTPQGAWADLYWYAALKKDWSLPAST